MVGVTLWWGIASYIAHGQTSLLGVSRAVLGSLLLPRTTRGHMLFAGFFKPAGSTLVDGALSGQSPTEKRSYPKKLSQLAKISRSAISRLEDADYESMKIETL